MLTMILIKIIYNHLIIFVIPIAAPIPVKSIWQFFFCIDWSAKLIRFFILLEALILIQTTSLWISLIGTSLKFKKKLSSEFFLIVVILAAVNYMFLSLTYKFERDFQFSRLLLFICGAKKKGETTFSFSFYQVMFLIVNFIIYYLNNVFWINRLLLD